jgi:signal transduction histidine kinase
VESGNAADTLLLAENLKQNQEKINFHGKRADGIVRSMLQHTKGGDRSYKMQPTDINALCEEYFRLSYHGFRAKDNSFNVVMKSDFDPAIGLIQAVPQDIARAVLNLINNAFYAVHEEEKKRISIGESYIPTVELSTKLEDNKVEIRVKDNGQGIPADIMEKIFQPFFTTKPTGQGTGLGLTLSYDIIKAHQGTLTVKSFNENDDPVQTVKLKKDTGPNQDSSNNQFTEFIISLPVK